MLTFAIIALAGLLAALFVPRRRMWVKATPTDAGLRIEYEWFEVAPEYNFDTDEFEDDLDASAGFLSLSFVYRF